MLCQYASVQCDPSCYPLFLYAGAAGFLHARKNGHIFYINVITVRKWRLIGMLQKATASSVPRPDAGGIHPGAKGDNDGKASLPILILAESPKPGLRIFATAISKLPSDAHLPDSRCAAQADFSNRACDGVADEVQKPIIACFTASVRMAEKAGSARI